MRRWWRLSAALLGGVVAVGLGSLPVLAYNCDVNGSESLSVDSLGPTGDSVATGASVIVTFNEPMAQNAVFFAIQPKVPGELTWVDDQTLQFQPARLGHGVSYEVSVGGRSAGGRLVRHLLSWRFTTVAGPPVAIAPGPSSIRVPILMYHYVRVNSDPNDGLGFRLSVTPADFAAQMDWLYANGYHTVTMQDLDAFLSGQRGLPSRPIVLTFDDGYVDFFTAALPILRSHDFTAVSYVVSGFVDQPRYMSASQVLAAQDAGIEIGSHTVGHVDLTRQSVAGLLNQVSASKAALEALLGRPVVSFCYPSGRFGSREAAAVAAAGYQDATTTVSGSWHSLADRYMWTRIRVSGGEGLAQFANAVVNY